MIFYYKFVKFINLGIVEKTYSFLPQDLCLVSVCLDVRDHSIKILQANIQIFIYEPMAGSLNLRQMKCLCRLNDLPQQKGRCKRKERMTIAQY